MSRRIFALLLAAGQSRRMGQPKQLLPYRDGTILEAVVESVLSSSADGLVVVANSAVAEFLGDALPERCYVAINSDADSEMLDSVKIGAARIEIEFKPQAEDGVMVVLADQPQVSAGTITTCVEAYRLPKRHPGILIATYRGRRGHPSIFSVGLLREVQDWDASRKLSDLAEEHPEAVREMAITIAPMPLDVNTPDDYQRLTGNG
jgi:molybdenum cofactor cytidylyltransferase